MKKNLVFTILVVGIIAFIAGSGYGEQSKAANNKIKGKIEVMTVAGYYMDYFKTKVIPAFKKEYPNIEISVVDDGNGVVDTRLAAGNPPDLYTGTLGAMPIKYAKADKLVNMENLDGYPEIQSKLDKKFGGKVYDGVYFIPWLAVDSMMIYNKELFVKAGLDPKKPPKTFDEFLSYAQKITALPSDGKTKYYGACMWNDSLVGGGWYWAMMAPIYYSMNQGKYKILNSKGTDIVFDKPEAKMVEFFKFCQKMQGYAPISMAGNKDFFSRNIGMWLQFGYGWKNNFKNAAGKPMVMGDDVFVAPMPVAKKGDIPYTVYDGRSLLIFKSNPAKEKITWLLVKFMMNRDDLYVDACKDLNMLPTMPHVQKNPYFLKPDVKPFVDQMKYALPLDSEAVADPIEVILMQAYSDSIVLKKTSVEDALKKAAEKARAELKKY